MKAKLLSLFTLTILLFNVGVAFGQTAQVRGFVYDKTSGEPVIFTNVYLRGTTQGASTDVNGYYVISKIEPGEYDLMVTAVGYDSLVKKISLKAEQLISENLFVEETAYMLGAVQISAQKQESRTETRTSVINISPKQIEQLPSIGGQADIAQYLQVLPGVIFTGDQGGQLYIRGGSPVQNKVLLDGMVIFNPFHSIGLFSVFETDIMKNADIYTGGFNAQYGGRISSIMDISYRDGNKSRISGKVQVNTFGANVLVEGPLKKQKEGSPNSSSFIFSAKNSYLEQTSQSLYGYLDDKIDSDNGLPFNYLDLYAKLSLNTSSGSKISFFGFRFDDKVNNYKSISSFNWMSYGMGGNFVIIPGGSSALIEATVSYTDYKVNLDDPINARESRIGNFNANVDMSFFMGKNSLKWGLELKGGTTNYEVMTNAGYKVGEKQNTTEIGVFMQYKAVFGEKFIIEPGIRAQYYASLSELSPEPRLSMKYNALDWFRIKASGGLYSQNIVATASEQNVVNLFYGFLSGPENIPDQFLGDDVNSKLQKGAHIILGFEVDITPYITVNLEGYYKKFGQLSNVNRNKIYNSSTSTTGSMYEGQEYGTEKDQLLYTDYMIEEGDAEGIDLSVKVEKGRLYVWTAYSFAFVNRTGYVTENGQIELKDYPPFYDRRHNLNLMAVLKMGNADQWELSFRWNMGTGFPFTPTGGYSEEVGFTTIGDDYVNQNGELTILYDDINSARLPTYHRLDVGIKRLFFLGKHTVLEADLGCTNMYDQQNIFYVDRITNEEVYQLPILPSFGLTFRF